MKTFCLTLSLLFGTLLLAPSAMAQQFGMDQQYNSSLNQSAQPMPASGGATGTQAYTTAGSAWSDFGYVEGQQSGVHIPGTLQAPLQALPQGMASTYVGNTGQFIQGVSSALGKSLPITQTGLNAINGGYTGQACDFTGSGGFPGGGSSRIYPSLPPTSTSLDVDLNVAQ